MMSTSTGALFFGNSNPPSHPLVARLLLVAMDSCSVYSVSWSCCDAWIFASLSYDGRVSDLCLPNVTALLPADVFVMVACAD